MQFFIIINFINLILIAYMVFAEHKKPHRVAIWILVFTFLPIVGFLVYFLFGIGLKFRAKRILKSEQKMNLLTKKNLHYNLKKVNKQNLYYKDIINFNILNNFSPLLQCENLRIFTLGTDFVEDLKTEISKATKTIYIFSYIFASDIVGNELLSLLQVKLSEGVKVILMYDSFGSRKTDKKVFESLKQKGAFILEFFPPILKIFHSKINYRNHKKIFIIDDNICYMGGMNIRDDHMGRDKNLSPWKDTQIRFSGTAVLRVLEIYFKDLNLATKEDLKIERVNTKMSGNIDIQLLSTTPTDKTPKIEDALILAISKAKERIMIETPYLILDEKIFTALVQASLKGVAVKIIMPKLSDGFLVHNASFYYAKQLIENNIEVYFYNGFLHSKTVLIDRDFLSVGSSNLDMRSFNLNFEITAFIYNYMINRKYFDKLSETLKNSDKITQNYFEKMNNFRKLAISFSKLFSPVL